ncbi:MAG: hypothetical protein AVDCRST_MAG78-3256 [uncultured Rubrobacteraceae bacterium]|uniref:Uncharacterized protein n=1 Tax=uncultured Rubrobacteraceae bacterium TaxID=349277 RepID=A0A6J4QP08_9ACTN|nr:MAG: hypothetical protein AVDCRST_MAG78-3256 [uncultured Rubrobacteraceae bacterium]
MLAEDPRDVGIGVTIARLTRRIGKMGSRRNIVKMAGTRRSSRRWKLSRRMPSRY